MKIKKRQNCVRTGLLITLCLLIWNPQPGFSFPQKGGEAGTAEGGKARNISMQTVSGTVVETMDSGGYTYALVNEADAMTWVALPKSNLAVGNEITCQAGMVMNNFNSASLNHTFRRIVFSSGIATFSRGTAPQAPEQLPDEMPEASKTKEPENWKDF